MREVEGHFEDVGPQLFNDDLTADGHARVAADRDGRVLVQ